MAKYKLPKPDLNAPKSAIILPDGRVLAVTRWEPCDTAEHGAVTVRLEGILCLAGVDTVFTSQGTEIKVEPDVMREFNDVLIAHKWAAVWYWGRLEVVEADEPTRRIAVTHGDSFEDRAGKFLRWLKENPTA